MSAAAAVALDDDVVARVIEVTGASVQEAEQLLGACDNNIEAAIMLYFEQSTGDVNSTDNSSATTAVNAAIVDDDVRAPIAPTREQLVQPEDDNFYAPPSNNRLTRASQRIKICPLRDFAREGALMEAELSQQLNSASNSNSSSQRHVRAVNMVKSAQQQRHNATSAAKVAPRLEDLFRPPTDLLYAGTFQAARSRATVLKHWLLVNVQSDNFDSQVLNRDVWADKTTRKLIRRQFLLWQVDADSNEGRRFIAFYHCARLPYVCIVDPRTGEEMWHSAEPKQENIMPDLRKFLTEHKDFADDMPSTSSAKRCGTNEIITLDDSQEAAELTNGTAVCEGGVKKRSKLMELSEAEQIALAIRNSMRENGVNKADKVQSDDDDNNSELDSIEEFNEEDVNTTIAAAKATTSFEQLLGSAINELTMLKLRLLDAAGADETVQLRWPSDTPLSTVRAYISQQQPHVAKQPYKLICAFPRKTLGLEHDDCTLKEMGLHPSANLHISLDD